MSVKILHIPVVGTTYGQWTVISTTTKNNKTAKDRNTYWNVRCSCGKETFRSAYTLISGKTKACMSCAKTVYNSNTFIQAYFNSLIKYRIPEKNFDFDITVEYVEELFNLQQGKCALSGISLLFAPFKSLREQTISLDRIDSKLGYIKGNVQWVHKHINMMKGSLSQSEFIDLCTLITNHSKC